MLKNRIVLSALSALFLSSSCLFGMDCPKDDAPAGASVKRSAVGCESVSVEPAAAVAVPAFLELADRPAAVQAAVDQAFGRLAEKSNSYWSVFNGDTSKFYGLAALDDDQLLLYVLHNRSRKGQKIIRIADFGGGRHAWTRERMRVVNAEPGLPDDLKVHFFSLRAEGGKEHWGLEDRRCVLFEYHQCEIEDLPQALEERFIHEPFDLIVSHWTFRHCADPLMAAKLAYDRLSADGFFLSDGFWVSVNNGGKVDTMGYNSIEQQLLFLKDTRSDFLIYPFTGMHSLNQFVIQKTQEGPCQLPLHYDGRIVQLGEGYQVGSKCVTCYTDPHNREVSQEDFDKLCPHPEKRAGLAGSQRLYELFKEANLFDRGAKVTYAGDFSKKTAEAAPQ